MNCRSRDEDGNQQEGSLTGLSRSQDFPAFDHQLSHTYPTHIGSSFDENILFEDAPEHKQNGGRTIAINPLCGL